MEFSIETSPMLAQFLSQIAQDRRGSVYMVSNTSGAATEWTSYTAYGEPTLRNAAGTTISNTAVNGQFGFNGLPQDFVLGVVDMRARTYRPVLGRFLSPDPLGLIDGTNRFAFAGAGPLSFRDPFGLNQAFVHESDREANANAFNNMGIRVEFEEDGWSVREGLGIPTMDGVRSVGRGLADANQQVGNALAEAMYARAGGPEAFWRKAASGYSDSNHYLDTIKGIGRTGYHLLKDPSGTITSFYTSQCEPNCFSLLFNAMDAATDGPVIGAVADGVIGIGGAGRGAGTDVAPEVPPEKPQPVPEPVPEPPPPSQPSQPQVQVNRTNGNAFRDEIAEALRADGRTVRTEVYKWTIFGPRFIDIEVEYNGQVLGGIETKWGESRYTPAQRAKDAWLLLSDGYRVNLLRGGDK
jgi:RHS repeat-associated protein